MTLLDRVVTKKFVEWQAHMWFAAFVTTSASWFAAPAIVLPLVLGLAAFKEFYIDKHFETGQRFVDNLRDFAGYASGAVLGWFVQSKIMDFVVAITAQFITQAMAACHRGINL